MHRLAASSVTVERRRLLLGATGAALLPGCATPLGGHDRIVDVAARRDLALDELLPLLRRADHVLLGERHDNPAHHQRRGALMASLGATTVVVAEHLPRGARVSYGSDILRRLELAGFESKAWQWPQHEALFTPVISSGQSVVGGNVPRALVRQLSREGPASLPAELRELIEAAPLAATAQAALDADLIDGHCGQLPGDRLPAMRMAQRARDASMALAMKAARGRPTVLVAGNGHVRDDFGVPVMLRRLLPQDQVLSIGFAETGAAVDGAPYTYLWVTAGVERADPCAGFRFPTPKPG